jgi:conjugal transfer pilin signal peptidase TrbI|tara:strand:+ start:13468 stop:13995 length:528 start_codon:yes stop_codon:yes gene_type:complete
MTIKSLSTKAHGRIKRIAILTALVSLPFAVQPFKDFRQSHAFLLNASPSLPNWAFWLDKHAPIKRGGLIFFIPRPSNILTAQFGSKPQLFGKYVLGMPGDIVTHKGKDVLINGKLVARTKSETRLGLKLTKGPAGAIPDGCYYAGSAHKDGFDSRYADIGFVCGAQILGSGRAIL